MYIKQTNSTNTLMRELIAQGEKVPFIRADYQMAGRGQSGNGWESEEGKNLLCSILIEKNILATQQFDISVLVAVALHRLIISALPKEKSVTIKWPNDLYVGDKKIAGVLIETALMGTQVQWAIAGVGLNIYQTHWVSDAPNPTSLSNEGMTMNGELDEWMNNLLKSINEVNTCHESALYVLICIHCRSNRYLPFHKRPIALTSIKMLEIICPLLLVRPCIHLVDGF